MGGLGQFLKKREDLPSLGWDDFMVLREIFSEELLGVNFLRKETHSGRASPEGFGAKFPRGGPIRPREIKWGSFGKDFWAGMNWVGLGTTSFIQR